MRENLTGLVKIVGITVLLVMLWGYLSYYVPEKFLTTNNIENLLRRTALYGILGIGVAFVIISSGIDLSIGSLVCFTACLLAIFLQVSFSPLEKTDVWQIDKANQSMIVSAGIDYDVGDFLWYDGERRDTGLIEIAGVEKDQEFEGKPAIKLTLAKAPRKDRIAENGEPVGSLSQTYPLASVDQVEAEKSDEGKELAPAVTTISTSDSSLSSRLKAKDKVKLVHAKKSKSERVVKSVTEDGNALRIVLASPAKSIDAEYMMIPIKRSVPMSIPVAIASVLGIALLIGIFNGYLITKWKQRPFIVTLCGLMIFRSLSRWLTNDQPVGFIEYSDTLGKLGLGRWIVWTSQDGTSEFGIPYAVFFFVAIAILAMIFLNLTIWGRYIKALGRNEEAARFSGINTNRMTILAYVICAVLTGIGGILFAIDSNSVAPSSFGNFFELYAIAAAVLGGCSLRGGEGSIIGVIVGTALMQTLYNSIVMLGIPDELELTIIGVVILFGVLSDEVVRRVAGKFRKSDA